MIRHVDTYLDVYVVVSKSSVLAETGRATDKEINRQADNTFCDVNFWKFS